MSLRCAGMGDKPCSPNAPIARIDNRGWVYCEAHGAMRSATGTPCRKLRKHEVATLESGGTVEWKPTLRLDETESKRVFTHLDPGTYRLTQDWKPDNPDRRRSGPGTDSPDGFRKGTRFEVREDNDVHAVAQHAGVSGSWYQLWPLRGRCIASGNAQGWTVTEAARSAAPGASQCPRLPEDIRGAHSSSGAAEEAHAGGDPMMRRPKGPPFSPSKRLVGDMYAAVAGGVLTPSEAADVLVGGDLPRRLRPVPSRGHKVGASPEVRAKSKAARKARRANR